MKTLILLCLGLCLVGCGHKKPPVLVPPKVETVTVEVPVVVKVKPPAELLSAVTPPLPVFVAPSDPQASSALTVEGERMLRGMIEDLLARIRAWEAWAKEP